MSKDKPKNVEQDPTDASNAEEMWSKTCAKRMPRYVARKLKGSTSIKKNVEDITIESEEEDETSVCNEHKISTWCGNEVIFQISSKNNSLTGYLIDLASLTRREWANDNVVNAMIMISENKYSTGASIPIDSLLLQATKENRTNYPYSFCLNEDYVPKLKEIIANANAEKILIPVCTSGHWFLVVIDIIRMVVIFYDSLRGHCKDSIRKDIKDEIVRKGVLPEGVMT